MILNYNEIGKNILNRTKHGNHRSFIFEGVDGIGKTSCVNHIVNDYKNLFVRWNVPNMTEVAQNEPLLFEKLSKYGYTLLADYIDNDFRNSINVQPKILDRWFPSEYVYRVMRQSENRDYNEFDFCDQKCKDHFTIVYLRCNKEYYGYLAKRNRERGEPCYACTADSLQSIDNVYMSFLEKISTPSIAIEINPIHEIELIKREVANLIYGGRLPNVCKVIN